MQDKRCKVVDNYMNVTALQLKKQILANILKFPYKY